MRNSLLSYAICKTCNVTVHVAQTDTDTPSCPRCHGQTSWLITPVADGASIDEEPTIAESRPSGSSTVEPDTVASEPATGPASQPRLGGLPSDGGPISRPTMPLNRGSDSQEASALMERVTGGGSGLFPRETPSRMDIPELSAPKKERALSPTRPTDPPLSRGPTPMMISILIIVAALTGIVLALLSP